ncbi:MAG: endo alpha-1,4 polygalactosaminidase [Anaerolineae bacterium]
MRRLLITVAAAVGLTLGCGVALPVTPGDPVAQPQTAGSAAETVLATSTPVTTFLPIVMTSGHTIWQPSPGTSWQWQLSGTIDTSFDVEMVDIDLFDAPQSVIDQLHADGRVVICYFSAGSWEDWRDDAGNFPASLLGKPLDGWPDEKWLDIRQLDTLGPLMQARLDVAVQKQCDGVEPDNVDGYSNNSGFPLSAADQLAYNRWLAEQAHSRGLSIGLKNDLDQIPQLVDYFDWALNEQCFEYDECDTLTPFVAAGKAVFGVEYSLAPEAFCAQANALNFDWLKKNLDLDAERIACR